jgi:hypothetical protein
MEGRAKQREWEETSGVGGCVCSLDCASGSREPFIKSYTKIKSR